MTTVTILQRLLDGDTVGTDEAFDDDIDIDNPDALAHALDATGTPPWHHLTKILANAEGLPSTHPLMRLATAVCQHVFARRLLLHPRDIVCLTLRDAPGFFARLDPDTRTAFLNSATIRDLLATGGLYMQPHHLRRWCGDGAATDAPHPGPGTDPTRLPIHGEFAHLMLTLMDGVAANEAALVRVIGVLYGVLWDNPERQADCRVALQWISQYLQTTITQWYDMCTANAGHRDPDGGVLTPWDRPQRALYLRIVLYALHGCRLARVLLGLYQRRCAQWCDVVPDLRPAGTAALLQGVRATFRGPDAPATVRDLTDILHTRQLLPRPLHELLQSGIASPGAYLYHYAVLTLAETGLLYLHRQLDEPDHALGSHARIVRAIVECSPATVRPRRLYRWLRSLSHHSAEDTQGSWIMQRARNHCRERVPRTVAPLALSDPPQTPQAPPRPRPTPPVTVGIDVSGLRMCPRCPAALEIQYATYRNSGGGDARTHLETAHAAYYAHRVRDEAVLETLLDVCDPWVRDVTGMYELTKRLPRSARTQTMMDTVDTVMRYAQQNNPQIQQLTTEYQNSPPGRLQTAIDFLRRMGRAIRQLVVASNPPPASDRMRALLVCMLGCEWVSPDHALHTVGPWSILRVPEQRSLTELLGVNPEEAERIAQQALRLATTPPGTNQAIDAALRAIRIQLHALRTQGDHLHQVPHLAARFAQTLARYHRDEDAEGDISVQCFTYVALRTLCTLEHVSRLPMSERVPNPSTGNPTEQRRFRPVAGNSDAMRVLSVECEAVRTAACALLDHGPRAVSICESLMRACRIGIRALDPLTGDQTVLNHNWTRFRLADLRAQPVIAQVWYLFWWLMHWHADTLRGLCLVHPPTLAAFLVDGADDGCGVDPEDVAVRIHEPSPALAGLGAPGVPELARLYTATDADVARGVHRYLCGLRYGEGQYIDELRARQPKMQRID